MEEFDEPVQKVSKVFYAEMEEYPMTKTVLGPKDENRTRTVLWLPEDRIGVVPVSGGSFDMFVNKNTEPSNRARFEGETVLAPLYIALYPYDERATIADGSVLFDLKKEQVYKSDSFDQDAFPMIARSSDTNSEGLEFCNLCGLLEINLTGEEMVTKIIFSSDKKVSGKFTVDSDYEEYPEIIPDASTSTSTTLNCGEGVQLNVDSPTPFYFVLPPGIYENFTIMIQTSEGKIMFKQAKNPLTIKRSRTAYAGALEYIESVAIDLSMHGTANCYIVSDSGPHRFNASVIGNGTYGIIPDGSFHTEDPNIDPVSVEVIWESGPADAKVEKGDLLSEVTLKDGYVHFISTGEEGNALIAAKDADGNILWSWHIWMTDQPLDQTYLNSAGTFVVQDRNLGATRADRGTGDQWKEAKGIMYEWGRKDPFIFDDVDGKIVGTRNSNRITIAESISDPTCFAGGSNGWESSGSKASLWLPSKKTIYDPCPVGYKVARKEIWADFSKTGSNVQNNVDEFNVSGSHNNGWDFYYDGTNTTYIPANDAVNYYYQYDHRNNIGDLWSSDATSGTKAYRWNYTYSDASNCGMQILYSEITSHAMSLRCMKDETHVDLAFPMVEMVGAKDVTTESVRILFNITSEGLAEVTEAGVIYGTAPGLSLENGTKVLKTGDEDFVDITGLSEGARYYVVAYATNSYGTTYSKEIMFYTEFAHRINLSKYGTSNCYIVSEYGAYAFDASVRGSSTETVGTPASAEVLWETKNITKASAGEIIRSGSVELSGNFVNFVANGVEGNALIAVKDELGAILWSWHIWITDQPQDQHYSNSKGDFYLLDRNLGATRADRGTGDQWRESIGALYQWGRKDPLIQGIYTANRSIRSIESSILHPTEHATLSSWNYSSYWESNNNKSLWTPKNKTIYDPCPQGYTVANIDAYYELTVGSAPDNGYYAHLKSSTDSWFPLTPIIWCEGSYIDASTDVIVWSSCSSNVSFCRLRIPRDDNQYWLDADNSAMASPVRCMREHEINVKLTTTDVKDVTKTSAIVSGSMEYIGTASVTELGFVYSSATDSPNVNSSKVSITVAEGSFSENLTGLKPSTRYYVRTYAREGDKIAYGNVISFTTTKSGGTEGLPEEDYEWE